jgi:hypothetical protein
MTNQSAISTLITQLRSTISQKKLAITHKPNIGLVHVRYIDKSSPTQHRYQEIKTIFKSLATEHELEFKYYGDYFTFTYKSGEEVTVGYYNSILRTIKSL